MVYNQRDIKNFLSNFKSRYILNRVAALFFVLAYAANISLAEIVTTDFILES